MVEALVPGGKASAGPPLGPALGPLGVNVAQVVAKINEQTKDLNGMQVPVKIKVKSRTEFEIEVEALYGPWSWAGEPGGSATGPGGPTAVDHHGDPLPGLAVGEERDLLQRLLQHLKRAGRSDRGSALFDMAVSIEGWFQQQRRPRDSLYSCTASKLSAGRQSNEYRPHGAATAR